jgi:thymidylate synthase (FAD)
MPRAVRPSVHLLGYTTQHAEGMMSFLKALGVSSGWSTDAPTDTECIIEVAGRMCYKSFELGLNPNVTRIREGNKIYIDNILKQRHGSVLEHGSATFGFANVTRVFTHEMVRHRLCAFSQESLRFVRLSEINYRLPPAFEETEIADIFHETVAILEEVQNTLAETCGLNDGDDNDKSFQIKKQLSSAFRRLAPIGLATNIMVTTNHRNWRHIIEQRTAPGAEEEIKEVFGVVASVLRTNFPNIYQDMYFEGDGNVKFGNGRV